MRGKFSGTVWMAQRHSSNNPYTRLFGDALENKGCRVYDFRMRNLFKPRKGDIVHIHWLPDFYVSRNPVLLRFKSFLIFCYFFLFRILGIGTVWSVNNLFPHENLGEEREKIARKIISKGFSRLFVFGPESKNRVSSLFKVAAGKINIVPHGTYSGAYSREVLYDLHRKYGFDPDTPLFVYFGLMRPYKGVEQLVEAFTTIDNANVLICGGGAGEYVELLHKKIRLSDRNNIAIEHRYISDEEIYTIFSQVDCVILPFQAITMSGVLILALTFRRPVITVNIGEMGYYIKHGQNGLLMNNNSPESIKTSVQEFLLNQEGLKGSDDVENMIEWSSVAEQTVRNYYSCFFGTSNEQ